MAVPQLKCKDNLWLTCSVLGLKGLKAKCFVIIDLQLHKPDLFNNLRCLFNINNIPKTTEYTYFPAGLLIYFLMFLPLKIDGEEDKQWYPEFHRTT